MNNEQTLGQELENCERIVEDLLNDRLGDSANPKKNEKVKYCIEKLQSLNYDIERLSIFSINDQIDELPTSTIRYLLVPAYLAYVLQEIQVEHEKRKVYLTTAKSFYREFLQNLLIFELINFKLPWMDEETESKTGLNAPRSTELERGISMRQQKITRIVQMEQMEKALAKLRFEDQRNNDEAARREISFVLIRIWSIRAIKELEMIDEELRMLEQSEAVGNSGSEQQASTSNKKETVPKLKPFIIARSEQQKKIFGLGYPSIPTVTVDEWFDQMQKNGGFGKIGPGKKLETFTIDKRQNESGNNDDDENDEEKRQTKIRMDEWKDMNPRGWGNTHNKG